MGETKLREESKKEKKERKKEKKSKKDKKSKIDKGEEETLEANVEESHMSDHPLENDSEQSNDDSEIEIDLNALVPLSKKQQRLLKKGKLDLEKIAKKNPPPKPADAEGSEKPAKSPFGVWIGNLSYDTSKEDIIRFITAKTAGYDEDENDLVSVKESDITRVNLPKKANKSKGFAYVDLPSEKHVNSVVALSESNLNGRNLLIKSSSSFEGRPEGDANKSLLKNPPLRILFVGNLSFDTTEDNLEEHFRHCGQIVRIRMATFQDSGKCKGFAFIDFKDESGPTTALKSKLAKKLINRPLRLEYGEDRSKRNPRKESQEGTEGEPAETSYRERNTEGNSETTERTPRAERAEKKTDSSRPRPPKRNFREAEQPAKRMKSSVALATAQRASAAIVPSQGKKITFD